MSRPAQLELLGLIGAGAVGAGVHAAIAPEHLREWVPLGMSFVAVTVLLAAVAALAVRPTTGVSLSRWEACSHCRRPTSRPTGRDPPLDPEREPFDALGVVTSAIEALGLLLAAHISRPQARPSASNLNGRNSMTHRTTRLAGRLSFAAAVAGIAAALALLVATDHPATAHAEHVGSSSAKAAALNASMAKLWEDHIVWTRMVIVDFAAGLPDLKAAETRLLQNQTDIGNAIKPYYGTAAGHALTQLLRTHILEAVPVLQAAKNGDKPALTKAVGAWYANAHQIAAFLSKANPHAWPLSMTTSMMKRHLDLTTKEAVSRLQGHWQADIAAYDAVHQEILEMASMLSDGIIAQHPNQF